MENSSILKNARKVRMTHLVSEGDVLGQIDIIETIANKTDRTFLEVCEVLKLLEIGRQNWILLDNGNAFDEQLADLATHFQDITLAIQGEI